MALSRRGFAEIWVRQNTKSNRSCRVQQVRFRTRRSDDASADGVSNTSTPESASDVLLRRTRPSMVRLFTCGAADTARAANETIIKALMAPLLSRGGVARSAGVVLVKDKFS